MINNKQNVYSQLRVIHNKFTFTLPAVSVTFGGRDLSLGSVWFSLGSVLLTRNSKAVKLMIYHSQNVCKLSLNLVPLLGSLVSSIHPLSSIVKLNL